MIAPRARPAPGPARTLRRLPSIVAWLVWSAAGLRAAPCDCPTEYISAIWASDEGLPHNVVNRIRQDASGYLWAATAAGLARFDGFHFETFELPAEYTKGGYALRDLTAAGTTHYLLPPLAGVVQYTGGVFSRHPVSDAVRGKVADVFAEPTGVLWAGTYEGELTRWSNGRVERFGLAEGISRRGLGFFFARAADGRTWVAAGDFLGHYEDGRLVRYPASLGSMLQAAPARDGGIWVIADGHLYRLADGNARLVLANPPWLDLKTSVRCLLEDRTGTLWIGTARQGLFRYHCGEVEHSGLFLHQGIQALHEDQEGNVWVATDGAGIGRVRPKAFRIFDHEAGLPESLSTSVCEDERGDMWFANRAGGLARLRQGQFEVFPYRDGRSPVFISAVCPDRAGYLWVGATTGVFRIALDNPSVLERVATTMRHPRVLFRSRRGDIWAATAGDMLGYFREGEFIALNREQGFQGEGITAIAEDQGGTIWCGASTGELYRWQEGVLTRFDADDGLPPSPIHALHPHPAGQLWIGTLRGLILRDEHGFHTLTSDHGLPTGMVLQIQEDDRARLWFGGSSGLFHVGRHELINVIKGRSDRAHVVAHGRDEGLPGISPSTDYQPSTWKDAQGRLWFTTYKGVISVDPESVSTNAKPPPVFIKHVRLDGRELDLDAPLLIPPGSHELEFSFAALSYTAPGKVRLRHQLEGFDRQWIETTQARSARYSRLPPGRYRMRVIACNNDGVWNESGATLSFHIRPAWWQTRWFAVASFVTFTASLGLGVRYWTQRRLHRRLDALEREHALDRERARIARDLHDELGASITGIGMLANRLRGSSHEEVRPVLEQLTGRTQRLASDLERVVWTVSPKNNSLDRLAAFVGRFAQNFYRDTGVICLVRNRHPIPPLPITPDVQHHVLAVAKEAINNALKHARATQVVIESSLENRIFSLVIRDNGVGFDPVAMERSERNGLRNMRSRMLEIHGEIRIASAPGQGCTLTVRVPISTPPLLN